MSKPIPKKILQPDRWGNVDQPTNDADSPYNFKAVKNDYRINDADEKHPDPLVRRIKYVEGYKAVCREPHLFWTIEVPSDRDRTKVLPVELQGTFTSLDVLTRTVLKVKGLMI